MAKKKRLNKKMIIVLASIGAVLAGLVIAVVIWRLPKDPGVYAARGAEHLEKGDYKAAVYNYRIASGVAKVDDSRKPEFLLAFAEANLEWNRKDKSLLPAERGRNAGDARAALMEAMRYRPDFVEAQRILTEIEYGVGRYQGDLVRCIKAIDALLALVPDDHEVLYRRAQAESHLAATKPEYLKPALTDFELLVKRAPDQDKYWLGLAETQSRGEGTEKLEKVEQTYKDALNAIPKSVDVRVAYKNLLLRKDRKEEAFGMLKDALEAQPDSVRAHREIGRWYRKQDRDFDKALASFKKAEELDPGDYLSYAEQAEIHVRRDATAEAEAVLLKGLETIEKGKTAEPEGIELQKYNVGVVILNHQLSDVLLDRPAADAARGNNLQRVRNSLKAMQEVAEDSSGLLAIRIAPYVAKVEGRLAMVERRYVKAEKLLRQAYDSFAGVNRFDPKTANLLITLYYRMGEPGEARKIIARYLQIRQNNPRALMALVKLSIDSCQYDQAQRQLQIVMQQDSSEAALSLKAGLDTIMGRISRVPAGLKELDPYAVKLFLRRAQQLWLEGEQKAAVQLISGVVAKEPKQLAPIVQLLRWYGIRKETALANALFARARKTFKDNPAALNQLVLRMESDPKRLLAHQLALAQREPNPVRRELRIASIYLAYRQEKKFLEHIAAAEAKDPRNPAVVAQMFEYALGKGNLELAKKYAKIAAEDDIDAVGGRMFRGRLAAARRQWDEAIGLYREALRIRPRFSRAHTFMGHCLLAKGKIDQAREQYESAYSQNPSGIPALRGLIRVSEVAGKAADYKHWLKLAYKIAPQNPDVRERYLRLIEAQENPEKIIKQREQVLRSQPNNLINLTHLAALYEKTGRLGQAEQAYRAMMHISGGAAWSVTAMANYLNRRNRDAEARSMLADYAAKATDKVLAYLMWANYLDTAGSTDQAGTVYKKAIATNPADERGYRGVAAFHERHKRWDKAVDFQQEYLNRAGRKAPPRAHRDMINYLIEADRLKEAEQRITGILDKHRGDIGMWTQKGRVHLAQKDYKRAGEALEQALKIRPDYVPALIHRANLHLANRNRTLAVTDLEAARRAGAPPETAVRIARIYESMGDFGNAHTVLRGLLADSPEHPAVLKALAGFYERRNQWPAMEEIVQTGKKAYPKDVFYRFKEVQMWRRRKVPSKALAAAEEAVGLAPDNAVIAILRMEVLNEAGMYEEAISAGKALRTRKEVAAAAMALTGTALAKSGRKADADAEFVAAIKAATPGKQLLFVVGQVRLAYTNKESLEKLEQWVNIRPDDSMIHRVLADYYQKQGDHERTAEHLNKALAKADSKLAKLDILKALGLTYSILGRHDQSAKAYRAALKIDPNDGAVLNDFVWLLAGSLKNPDEALPYARKAAKILPDNYNVLDTYGYVLLLKKNYYEARDVLVRSVRIRSTPANRLHLAQAYERIKRIDEALRHYRLGWELIKNKPKNPYYQEYREALKRLGGTPGGSARP